MPGKALRLLLAAVAIGLAVFISSRRPGSPAASGQAPSALRNVLARRRVFTAPACAYRRLLAAGSARRAALYIMDLARPGAA